MNRWNIPSWLESEVIERDKNCVYCRIKFSNDARSTKASWEHIINDENIINIENIALCCISCNASKCAKLLHDWLQTEYCKRKGINAETVAEVIKNALL